MNWKERVKEIIREIVTEDFIYGTNSIYENAYLKIAEEAFIAGAEAQKKICADNAECCEGAIVDLGFEIISANVNKDSILECPTAKFE